MLTVVLFLEETHYACGRHARVITNAMVFLWRHPSQSCFIDLHLWLYLSCSWLLLPMLVLICWSQSLSVIILLMNIFQPLEYILHLKYNWRAARRDILTQYLRLRVIDLQPYGNDDLAGLICLVLRALTSIHVKVALDHLYSPYPLRLRSGTTVFTAVMACDMSEPV